MSSNMILVGSATALIRKRFKISAPYTVKLRTSSKDVIIEMPSSSKKPRGLATMTTNPDYIMNGNIMLLDIKFFSKLE